MIGTSGRKDLSAEAFQKIMADFDPITAALKPHMEKFAHGKKTWALSSGKPAVEVAKHRAPLVSLPGEERALGALFDGININGSWDIQMWASLSKAYAAHAATHVDGAEFHGYVGMGSSADQSIFNKIEQPHFVGMLSEHQKANVKITWYACAGDPKTDMKVPDWRFKAGGVEGVYATGDRASMVAMAESENKRRQALYKDKGIDEGPGGATAEKKDGPDESIDGTNVGFSAAGEGHTLTVKEDKAGGGSIVMASGNPETLARKRSAVQKTVTAYEHEVGLPDSFKLEVMQIGEDVAAELSRIEKMTESELFAASTSSRKRKPDEVGRKRREVAISALDRAAQQIKTLAEKHHMPDLSPHGVEVAMQKAWEQRVLKPVQAQVDAILNKHKAQIAALIGGASVKYRGSLASGWKGSHKLAPDGSALRFDPACFDCDAFVEVPDSVWTKWQTDHWIAGGVDFVDLRELHGPLQAQLVAIQQAIRADLGANVPGYKKHRGVADFEFRLQCVGQSAHQLRTGKAYPEGALGKAGLPETEQGLRQGTAFVNDQPVDGRVMAEVHHGV